MAKDVGFWNIANILSLSRIPLGILCAFFILLDMYSSAIGVGIVAVLTDYLDGYLAKRKNQKTKIGGMLDPLTDKFFVIVVLAALTVNLNIELWKPFAILSREIIEGFAAGIAFMVNYKPRMEIKARFFGKIVTAMQFIALLAIVLKSPYQNILIYALITATVLALAQYVVLLIKSHSLPP